MSVEHATTTGVAAVDPDPLAPRCRRPKVMAALQAEWRAHGFVRVSDAFREAEAARWLAALRACEHVAYAHADPLASWQFRRFTWVPGDACDHPQCALGRWLYGPGRAWMAELTGIALASSAPGELFSDEAAKASFYDAYDDHVPGRAIAFQVQLVPAPWPPEWGGHLECLGAADGPVVRSVAPAWNALDLYDVRRPGAWRRMPMIVEHLDGVVVSGGLAPSSD